MEDLNKVDLKKLTSRDVGRWVEYTAPDGKNAIGKLKSWNDKYAFIVFNCNQNWDDYKNYTASPVDPKQLIFTDQIVG